MWLGNIVQWTLYAGGVFMALVGLLLVLFPHPFWLSRRWMFRSGGVTTDEQPASGALSAIRIQGALMLLVSLVFLAVVYFLLQHFFEQFEEASELISASGIPTVSGS